MNVGQSPKSRWISKNEQQPQSHGQPCLWGDMKSKLMEMGSKKLRRRSGWALRVERSSPFDFSTTNLYDILDFDMCVYDVKNLPRAATSEHGKKTIPAVDAAPLLDPPLNSDYFANEHQHGQQQQRRKAQRPPPGSTLKQRLLFRSIDHYLHGPFNDFTDEVLDDNAENEFVLGADSFLSDSRTHIGALTEKECRFRLILRPRDSKPSKPGLASKVRASLQHPLKKTPKNNEAGPPPLSQKMESASLHDTTLPLPHTLLHSPPLHAMSSDLDGPVHVTDHGVPSNLRSYGNNNDAAVEPLPHLPPQQADQDATVFEPAMPDPPKPSTPVLDTFAHALDQPFQPQPGPVFEDEQQETGYAMLTFPDSYHILKTPNLVLGRDEVFLRRLRQEKRQIKRREKLQSQKEQDAQQVLEDYWKEPSQPSQHGDDAGRKPSSADAEDDALEGRPTRGLLSNYSEQGGPVAYDAPSEDENTHFHRRRRNRMKPSSSSATSVAPRDLHFEATTLSAREGEAYTGSLASGDAELWAQLPVHTANPDDIKRISREHIIFSYDSENLRWVLHVVGNNAYVGDQLYLRGDRNIPLENGTEICISTLRIEFRLPIHVGSDDEADSDDDGDELSQEDFADGSESALDRRISNETSGDAEVEDVEESEQLAQKQPIKLKLKGPKKPSTKPTTSGPGKDKPAKAAGKAKATTEANSAGASESIKQTEKDKNEATPPAGDNATDAAKAEQAARPTFTSDSVLATLAPDQMPEKRKGPGRPPKNGLLSKRDERAVTRRKKEYERQGLPIPDFNVILAEVREEQKAKDALAKGNKLRPEGAVDAVESIEPADQTENGTGGQSQTRDPQASQSVDPAAGLGASSGLSRRPLRSPSPMKPMEEFTEEELKKPQQSYFYLLDEVLQLVGQADLQTIYDKFQKRWPYYKYTVTTNGWQSSIRHNLSQHTRFKAIGKVGKGQLWAVDHDVPREENAKKKKTPPPPRQPQMPMGNGQMPPGMPPYPHGPQQPAPGYNPQPVYNPGQGQYSSPYGQHPGQHQPQGQPPPGSYRPYMGPPNGKFAGPPPPPGPYPPPPHNGQPGQRPAQPPDPVMSITQDIMNYRTAYLARWPSNTPDFETESARFFKAVTYFSDKYHNTGEKTETPTQEMLNVEPYLTLKAIFDRHNQAKASAAAAGTHEPNRAANGTGHGATVAAGESGGNAQSLPTPPEQTLQQQVQQQNGQNAALPTAPLTNGAPGAGQDMQQTIASQTANAVAQADANSHGAQMSALAAANPNGQTAVPQPVSSTGPHTLAPASQNQQPSTETPAGQNEQHMAPAEAPNGAPQEAPAAAPSEPTANGSKKASPPAEQPRPTSAGVKRGAEDVEMQDGESEAKRQRTE